MRKVPAFLLFFFITFPTSSFAQSNTGDAEIPENIKTELRTFTKQFAKRFQKTRDVAPLIRTFFVRDFDIFCREFVDERDKYDYRPTKEEIRRLCTTFPNILYLNGLEGILDADNYDIGKSKVFPKRILKAWNLAMDEFDKFQTARTRKAFRIKLSRIEAAMREINTYLRRKNYESSIQYAKEVERLVKDPDYNYPITRLFEDFANEGEDEWVNWFRKLGPNTKAYSVGTPYGYAVMVVKVSDRYQIFGFWYHPGSD